MAELSGPCGPIVFVVDGDAAVCDALTVLLRALGYQVAAFRSVWDFLFALCPTHRGCLVVDLDLPELDGPALVRVVIERQMHLPAVLMTGRLHNRRLARHPPPGVVAILEKPFGPEELVAVVEAALDRGRAE